MKIVLEAFNGKMRSEIMDIPDNGTPIWDMMLDSGDFKKIGTGGDVLLETPSRPLKCRFEHTGMYQEDARVYQLVDIRI